jgi:shikimate kinase
MKDLLRGLNVYLIGMMGSGKSTIGKLLAEKLNYRFLDTDILIETIAGKTINEIFAQDGEVVFRELETQILGELSPYTRSLISTGGGIVLKPKNWSYLHYGLIVWLDAPVELLVQRLGGDRTRPLLKQADLFLKLTSLLEQRKTLYEGADLHILIEESQSPAEIVAEIIAQIPSKIKPEFTADLN